MAVHRIIHQLTGARAAAGTALVLGLVAIPVLPHDRQGEAPASASAGVRDAERETQLARIARWREIRREARARGQAAADDPAPVHADSLNAGAAAAPHGAPHPGD